MANPVWALVHYNHDRIAAMRPAMPLLTAMIDRLLNPFHYVGPEVVRGRVLIQPASMSFASNPEDEMQYTGFFTSQDCVFTGKLELLLVLVSVYDRNFDPRATRQGVGMEFIVQLETFARTFNAVLLCQRIRYLPAKAFGLPNINDDPIETAVRDELQRAGAVGTAYRYAGPRRTNRFFRERHYKVGQDADGGLSYWLVPPQVPSSLRMAS